MVQINNIALKQVLIGMLLLIAFGLKAQDPDETNLRQLQDLYKSKLINKKEYQNRRLDILGLRKAPADTAALDSLKQMRKQYRSTLIFCFAAAAVSDFDFLVLGAEQTKLTQNGGINFELGPASPNFNPNFAFGIEGYKNDLIIPIYGDFNLYFGHKHLMPLMHFGSGFIAVINRAEDVLVEPNIFKQSYVFPANGLLIFGGGGVKYQLKKHLAISAAIDYRFIAGSGAHHQFGLRFTLIRC
jgi:hypothetical protein